MFYDQSSSIVINDEERQAHKNDAADNIFQDDRYTHDKNRD